MIAVLHDRGKPHASDHEVTFLEVKVGFMIVHLIPPFIASNPVSFPECGVDLPQRVGVNTDLPTQLPQDLHLLVW